MNLLFGFLAGVLRGVIKGVLIVLTAVFAVSVLCVGLAAVAVMLLRFLFTGRRPAVFATFARFNQAAHQFRPGFRSGHAGVPAGGADIVDVEAHEIRGVLNPPLPPKTAE